MAFNGQLLTTNEIKPPAWQSYVMAVLVRCVSANRPDLATDWATEAGGTLAFFTAPDDALLSGMCIVNDGGNAIVAFQGTSNTLQLLYQVLQAPQGQFTGIDGSVHGYYGSCFFERLATFQALIDSLPPTFNFFFTGHSAGGAIAHVAYRWFDQHENFNALGAVTFGQPRTGNAYYAERTNPPFVRWIAQQDFIPGLPPSTFQAFSLIGPFASTVLGLNYVHARAGWILNNDGSISPGYVNIIDLWGPPSPFPFSRLRAAWPAGYNAHALTNYVALLYVVAAAQGSPIDLAPFRAINALI